ncbi:MAG: hypothetical protein RLZZ383_229 [Pseudomonadota bacterium]
MVAAVCLPAVAVAGDRVVGTLTAGGGYDYGSRQPVAVVDLGWVGDQTSGFAPVGKLRVGYGVVEERPLVQLQVGFQGALPAPDLGATPHLGLQATTLMFVSDQTLPFQVGTPTEGGFGAPAFLPGGMLTGELLWRREGHGEGQPRGAAAWAIGLALGAMAAPVTVGCTGPTDPDDCLAVRPVFQGGVTARLRFHEHVFLEAFVGPSPTVGLGGAFPSRSRLK